MSANGISHLQYKKDRQAAKLEQAKADRIAANKTRTNYDITQLPMQYATNDNDTSHSVDNPNVGGLVVGRPWTT
jgi:beta-mannanase